MSEKFRKIVSEPEMLAKKLREAIEKMSPKDYVKRNRAKKNASGKKDENAAIKDNIATGSLMAMKGGAWLAAGGAQFLLTLARWLTLDNQFIRNMEEKYKKINLEEVKKYQPQKIRSFAKNYPNVSSHIIWYFMLSATLFGGKFVANSKNMNDYKKSLIDWIDDLKWNDIDKETQYISPNREDFINAALEEYWSEVAVGLTELETYRAIPKRHSGEKRYTNGLGCTWHYVYNENGKLKQVGNTSNTRANSKEYNYEQAKKHLKYETLKKLKAAMLGKKNMNGKYAVALILAGYQRPVDISHIAARIENANNAQEVADAFMYIGKDGQRWKNGTLKRRWVCAAYALNLINSADLLEMNRDSFSRVELNNIIRNGHFLLDAETVKFVLSRTNSNSTVKEFLSDFPEGKKILAQVAAVDNSKTINLEVFNQQDKKIENSMACVNKGDKKFKRKKFEDAKDLYVKAIEIDPDNMNAYTALAETYNKLGHKNNSIEYYKKVTETVSACNKRMNKNKSLLYDRDIKAETYYAAGVARFEMAEIYKKSGDDKLANENYNLAKKNFETAIYNCKNGSEEATDLKVYEDALKRVKEKLKTKKIAFNSAKNILNKEIKEKNAVYAWKQAMRSDNNLA